MKSVYIFRGAPATGKGTLAPEFAKLLPTPTALIEQDELRWGFHLIGRSVSDVSDAEHFFANQNMALLYERYLKNGSYTIVVEGLFTWDDMSSSQGSAKQLVYMARNYGYTAKSIVLKADKAELLKRNDGRQYSVPRDEFDMLYDNIYRTVNDSEIVIDSTRQSAQETLEVLKKLTQTEYQVPA